MERIGQVVWEAAQEVVVHCFAGVRRGVYGRDGVIGVPCGNETATIPHERKGATQDGASRTCSHAKDDPGL